MLPQQGVWVWSLVAAAKSRQSCPTLCDPIDGSPPGSRPWDSPGKNTGVGCHFLLQCMKVNSESEAVQSCLTLRDPMDCSLPGSSVHRISQARVLEWAASAFSMIPGSGTKIPNVSQHGQKIGGGFPSGSVVKEYTCQWRRHGFDLWSRKIPHASKPVHHNYQACAPEPRSHNYWVHILKLLKPTCPRAHASLEKSPCSNEYPAQWKVKF